MITARLTARALSPQNTVNAYKKGTASYIPGGELANTSTFLPDTFESREKR
jgi:hypothetical protein